ncbi:response regulator [Paeniglutamicibacter sulfureus]|uniref:response regulator n=1 Tax=Paeniglutamicibacter sulfureus TaxID=43666 RepID=UPI002666B6EE|nr:response regulator [Paeniglutamicibacter sulfureus]MDO2934504.1 response regulator [Paeniglutamicibacter sulfureus]
MIRTLVVDDDPDIARLHSRYVAALEGFEVAGVLERGGPVLAFLEAEHVDLVLLDVNLPDMDGLQVLEDLRGSGHDTGVIMITAASERDTVRFAVGRGIDDYLVKPFTVTDFNRRLEAFRASRSAATDRPCRLLRHSTRRCPRDFPGQPSSWWARRCALRLARAGPATCPPPRSPRPAEFPG